MIFIRSGTFEQEIFDLRVYAPILLPNKESQDSLSENPGK
jgi:hypothetical protein